MSAEVLLRPQARGGSGQGMRTQLWAASGLAYPELIDRLVQLALRRDTGLR